jgi:hypothetical protein
MSFFEALQLFEHVFLKHLTHMLSIFGA